MLKRYSYQPEHEITFESIDGELLVNATEMARPFGKSPKYWLRNKDTKAYIGAVRKRGANSHLVKIIHGDGGGTWLHQKLALRFAQWLSPDFAVWVDERIEELLKNGTTSIQSMNRFDLMRTVIDTMEENNRKIKEVQSDLKRVEAKVTDVNTDYYSLSGYYRLLGRRFDFTKTEAQQMGRLLTSSSKLNGYTVNRAYSAKYGSVNTYHIDVLKSVLGF